MSELNGLENKPTDEDSGQQDWVKQLGREFMDHGRLFDSLWRWTRGMTPEQQNLHFGVAKREVVPFLDRANEVPLLEEKEAFALFHKYHSPDTGVRGTLLKELDTLLQDLDIRLPMLAKVIRGVDKAKPIVQDIGSLNFGSEGGPCIFFNRRTKFLEGNIQVKTYRALRNASLKRVALMKDQNRVLTRALEENGIQLPQEYVSIRQQLAELKWYNPDETASENTWDEVGSGLQSEATQSEDTAGYEDPEPDIKLVSLHEDPSSSAFIAHWDNREEQLSENGMETTSASHMNTAQLQDLLESLGTFECGRFFSTPLSQQEYPGYYQLVTQPCDLVTIKENLDNNPGYGARDFFNHIKLMSGNYKFFFCEGSYEFKMADRLELEMLKKLDDYGTPGLRAKNLFYEAPDPITLRPETPEANPPPEADETIPPSEADDELDNTVDEGDLDTSFAQDINNNYEDDYGEGYDDSFGIRDEVFDNQDDDRHADDDEHNHGPQPTDTPRPDQHYGSQDGHVYQSPSIYGAAEQPEDEDDRVKQSFDDFDNAKRYDLAHGHATRVPSGRGRSQQQGDEDNRDGPSHAASGTAAQLQDQDGHGPGHTSDTDKPADHSEELSLFNPYSSSPGASGPAHRPDDEDNDRLSSLHFPIPFLDPQLEATTGEPDNEDEHAAAHALKQPTPVALMNAEQTVVDLTSPPQQQTSRTDLAATKRARESDEQDGSSDDDAPLIKRLKTAPKSSSDEQPLSSKPQEPAPYATSQSLGKRSRDDSDDDDAEEREQPSKRKKVSLPPVPEPLPPAAASAAGEGGHDGASLTIEELFAPFQSPLHPAHEAPPPTAAASQVGESSHATIENLLRRIRNAQILPSPIPEPLSPVLAAADGPGSMSPPPESANHASDAEGHESRPGSNSPIAAADEPQREPATEDLGHTNNGTTTVSKLHKLPKYKKKSGSKGRGRPNRRWVFGHRFGNEYGLYIMGCPTKGCEPADTMIFATHPLKRNDAANHLIAECGHVFADDDDMVRKTCTQVISDDKKAVSIEWARKWNSDLMKEYGNEDCEDDNTF